MRFAVRAFLTAAFALSLTAPLRAQAVDDPLAELPADGFTREMAAHLLRRAGFGGAPAEIDALYALGLHGAVDRLVDYEAIPFDDAPAPALALKFPPDVEIRFALTQRGLVGRKPAGDTAPADPDRKTAEDARREVAQEMRQKDGEEFQSVRNAWLERMARSPRPLEEKMTLFWHGHFTSGQRDVKSAYHMYLQNELLRREATGNFGRLVHEIARDPAMLEYLDCRLNRAEHPNENFARELMELFTLGIGRYTEDDVKEAARAFTGWTFMGNDFLIKPAWHDWGKKTFLGRTGRWNGDDVIDIILAQDAVAETIATKLFRFFAHLDPTPETVRGLAQTLRASGYEIKPFLKRLFLSREFYSERSVGTQVKSPVILVASLLRTMGAGKAAGKQGRVLLMGAGMLGQALFDPPNVKGWPEGKDWITTSTLFSRYNLASAMVSSPRELQNLQQELRRKFGKQEQPSNAGDETMEAPERPAPRRAGPGAFDVAAVVKGLKEPAAIVDRLCSVFLAVQPAAELREEWIRYLKESSIDQERLHGLLELIVSTPEFQLS